MAFMLHVNYYASSGQEMFAMPTIAYR